MTITRIGATRKYAENWAKAFGEASAKSTAKGQKDAGKKKASAKKTSEKKSASPKKKQSGKASPAKKKSR